MIQLIKGTISLRIATSLKVGHQLKMVQWMGICQQMLLIMYFIKSSKMYEFNIISDTYTPKELDDFK